MEGGLTPLFIQCNNFEVGRVQIKNIVTGNAIYFAIIVRPKKSNFTIFVIQNFEQNKCLLFFYFTLKLFTLDSPAATLICEFYFYCLGHNCKVNKCCFVDCFHQKFRISCLQAFNSSSGYFFKIQNICINSNSG